MPGYALQQQNQDMVSLLASQFRLLYNPVHAFADAINMLQMIPACVGIWPGSIVNASAQRIDVSGNGNHLTSTNTINTLIYLAPCVYYNGSARHAHADGNPFDILGTETYISSTYRGLTIGCWVRFENASGSFEVVSGKWGAGGNSYKIQRADTGAIQFAINNGVTSFTVTSTAMPSANQWVFICGNYDPSTSIAVYVDDEKTTNTTSIPASLNNSTSTFTIGSQDAGTLPMTGWTFGNFLASANLPDIFINTFYQMTAPLFKTSI